MKIIVLGKKLERYLFEIIKISNVMKIKMVFFKDNINTNIESNDVIITDDVSIKKISQDLSNKIITVTFSPKYNKIFNNEEIITASEISNIIGLLSSESSFPIICDALSKQIFGLALKVAKYDATVLISGETGTGKEILAKYIHMNSGRNKQKFISMNCSAIPENLLESELFGYEKGAFSGAFQQKIGKFEAANNGTILLDEISEMPLILQAKLLRVLQEREITRLGSNDNIKINLRIIATTNKKLEDEVAQGRFREDLFYRLNVIQINSPRLNDRVNDIKPLANYFCDKYSKHTKHLSNEYLNMLENIQWKGNIRELENFIHRDVILSDENEILPLTIQNDISKKTLYEIEKEAILNSLSRNDGNRLLTSKELDISERTLRYKLAEYRKAINE